MDHDIKYISLEKDGKIILYDIYVNSEWLGSRSTKVQAEYEVFWYLNKDKILEEAKIKKEEDKKIKNSNKQSELDKVRIEEGKKDYTIVKNILREIIEENSDKVEQIKIRPQAINWFVGQVMKRIKGFEPMIIQDLVKKLINGT